MNGGWRNAIQSRQVYDGRVRSQSTETLVALQHLRNGRRAIALYDVKNDSHYHVPRSPGLSKGIPLSCQCVSLDGKLYVLGGLKMGLEESRLKLASAAVYVLDLPGQGQWKQCASMASPRQEFGCGVIHGKIYVFGGISEGKPVCGSEMFDPQKDVWYPIARMMSSRRNQKVTQVGDELFVHNGMFYESHFLVHNGMFSESPFSVNVLPSGTCTWKKASFAEVYHPLKDEWRIVEKFTKTNKEVVLMVSGSLHKMTQRGIHVRNNIEAKWKQVQSFVGTYGDLGPCDEVKVQLHAGIVVDNVILAMAEWWLPAEAAEAWDLEADATSDSEGKKSLIKDKCLIKSNRLLTESDFNEWIQVGYDWLEWQEDGMQWQDWEQLGCTLAFDKVLSPFLCLIQL